MDIILLEYIFWGLLMYTGGHEIIDEVIMGQPMKIDKNIFIPVAHIRCNYNDNFGKIIEGSIFPEAFIIINEFGEISYYNYICK